MESELKTCPWCKVQAKLEIWFDNAERFLYQVICKNNNCRIKPETAKYVTKRSAIAAWNRRADGK